MKVITATNLAIIAAMLSGVATIAAGASVPSEQTMVLGFFVTLVAAALLIGLSWPEAAPTRPTAKIYKFPVAAETLASSDAQRVA